MLCKGKKDEVLGPRRERVGIKETKTRFMRPLAEDCRLNRIFFSIQ
jgi:hypothetical protein